MLVKHFEPVDLIAHERLADAAEVACTANHPDVIHVLGHIPWNGTTCFLTEFLQGESLTQHLVRPLQLYFATLVWFFLVLLLLLFFVVLRGRLPRISRQAPPHAPQYALCLAPVPAGC